MDRLITLTDVQTLFPISSNINEEKALNPFILQAQEFDLKPFLGDPFFLAVYNDAPDFNIYGDLWNGCEYQWNTHTYSHAGLKSFLIASAYARYLVKANSTSTPYGIVQKETPYSSPTDSKVLALNIQQTKSVAVGYMAQVESYICRNSELFPLWQIGCFTGKKSGSISINRIKRMK